jgi:hypothetical protein
MFLMRFAQMFLMRFAQMFLMRFAQTSTGSKRPRPREFLGRRA